MHEHNNVVHLHPQAKTPPPIAIEAPPVTHGTQGHRLRVTLDIDRDLAATLLGGLSPFLSVLSAYQDGRTEWEKRRDDSERLRKAEYEQIEREKRAARHRLAVNTLRERLDYYQFSQRATLASGRPLFNTDRERFKLYHRLKCRALMRAKAAGLTYEQAGRLWGVRGASASKSVRDFLRTDEGQRLNRRLSHQ